ncbi:AAA family ATPase [Embleya sp. NPDC050493]|uniref:AAA family ATPase n=1 Tax=Embleya sp. NPDC050493 TaxID=3363989 RepID=UPI00378E14BB
MTDDDTFAAAVRAFDRTAAAVTELLAAATVERADVQARFPIEEWPQLPLERYALGLDQSDQDKPPYCQLIEFRTPAIGSMKGGSSAKHIMFWHRSGEWRMAKPLHGMPPDEAWQRLRGEFVAGFRHVEEGAWDRLDSLPILQYGPALVTKTFATYFPASFLPIYSAAHLRHFIATVGGTPAPGAATWRLNRHLRKILSERPEVDGWQPDELAALLYDAFDPRPAVPTMLKVAPGAQAVWWPDCRDDGYIYVGWDTLGDLAQFKNDAELRDALEQTHRSRPAYHLSLAGLLLRYRDLQPGDLVVANRGLSEILAVGQVTDDGYSYDASREEGRHRVAVVWDETYAQRLESEQGGWRQTFGKVSQQLWKTIKAGRQITSDVVPDTAGAVDPPADVKRVLDALERKGQVILYGPPGTGKTRLALSAALALSGFADAIEAAPVDRDEAIGKLLADERVTMVTFHPSYDYGDFVEAYKPTPAPAPGGGLSLALTAGTFHTVCTAAGKRPDEQFLLVIDEINRGDLPRIFGELVTLLETDKRGFAVTLPVSNAPFVVPSNVRIIGTMNTADRSVGHLDWAIRRRFAFVEVPPDEEVVSGSIGALNLGAFLTELNSRLTLNLGTDHCIGHAYLLAGGEPLGTESQLSAVFYDDIVPLLEDYTLGRAELMREILGRLLDPETGRPVRHMAPADLVIDLAAEFGGVDSEDVDG